MDSHFTNFKASRQLKHNSGDYNVMVSQEYHDYKLYQKARIDTYVINLKEEVVRKGDKDNVAITQ